MLEDELYPENWKLSSISEDLLRQEFLDITAYFAEKKWNHYELSNFSERGFECRHNRSYWDHSEYRGFGLSASSYEDEVRTTNSHSFQGYYRHDQGHSENLSDNDREIEAMMFSLRTNGWEYHENAVFNGENIEKLIKEGLLMKQDGKILPTKT